MPQVVGITVHLTFARRAFELADWYRARGSKVILGGLHVLSCPDECAPHADALALGDGVQLWPRILRDVEADCLQPRYVATYENDYRDDPPPRRSLLPRHSFLTTTSLIATRGCHNRCGFCYLATDGLRMPYRMRDPQQVVDEFRADDQPYAVFIDNNLGSRRDYLHAALRRAAAAEQDLERRRHHRRDRRSQPDPRHGARRLHRRLRRLRIALRREPRRRPQEDAEDRRLRPPRAHAARLRHPGERIFVLGFDHDRKDVFARTAEWIEENRLECATFHILTPYPATPLFRQMEAEGRLLHRDWTLYDTGHVVFRPKHMTPEELEDGYAWIYQRLFSHASIWRRRPQALAGGPALPGDVVPLQALQPLLASADQARPGESRVETAGRDDALAPRPLSPPARATRERGARARTGRLRRRLTSLSLR